MMQPSAKYELGQMSKVRWEKTEHKVKRERERCSDDSFGNRSRNSDGGCGSSSINKTKPNSSQSHASISNAMGLNWQGKNDKSPYHSHTEAVKLFNLFEQIGFTSTNVHEEIVCVYAPPYLYFYLASHASVPSSSSFYGEFVLAFSVYMFFVHFCNATLWEKFHQKIKSIKCLGKMESFNLYFGSVAKSFFR